ncbi:MAG TPA: hypothetical protein VFT39_03770 [Vicinamibacterales bacterium]|nr:hypothetical protein [Vicinamibacterales bacterium]
MRILILLLAMLFLVPASSMAQKLELSIALSPAVITFPSSDPDTVPLVSAPPMQLTYRVRGNGNAPWSLTVLAAGDLLSGPSAVDISNVTWVATPAPPFQNGTLSKTVAQRVASGTGKHQSAQHRVDHISIGELMDLQHGYLHANDPLYAQRALVVVALGALLLHAPSASAQMSVEVSPLRVELTAGPGSSTTQAITVANAGSEPVRVRAIATDWDLSRDGAPQFEGVAEGGPYSATSWIRVAPPE